MTYATDDVSQADGAPIECYAFRGSGGNYFLTSYHDPVTLTIGGFPVEFTPTPITRTAIELSTTVDSLVTMDFSVPSNHALANAYCFALTPPDLEVTVYRQHLGNAATDWEIEFTGEATDFDARGNWATIRTGSVLQARLSGNTSAVVYQRSCNHFLGDDRCKVDLAPFRRAATVVAISGTNVTVDDDQAADGYFNGGVMTDDATDEQQNIISNTANVIVLAYPMTTLEVGDAVTLTPGCNLLRLGDCKTKYNNVVNYGGFDFVPLKNPFEELNKEQEAQITRTVTKERTRKLKFPTESST